MRLLNYLQAKIAAALGDISLRPDCLALWPFPTVLYGHIKRGIRPSEVLPHLHEILPGDIILTASKPYFFSRYGIGGDVQHLMVFVGGHCLDGSVVHATSAGVQRENLLDICQDYTRLVVVRPSECPERGRIVAQTALDLCGREYDFCFDPKNKKYYCTEVGANALRAAGLRPPLPNRRRVRLYNPFKKEDVWEAQSFLSYKKILDLKSGA